MPPATPPTIRRLVLRRSRVGVGAPTSLATAVIVTCSCSSSMTSNVRAPLIKDYGDEPSGMGPLRAVHRSGFPLRYNREWKCKNSLRDAATAATEVEDRMSITTSSHAIVGTPQRPLRRGRDNCIVGGVCGGFATRLGIKERYVRLTFCLLALFFGLGVLLYMTFWVVLTRSGEDTSIIQRIFLNRREAQFVLVAFIFTLLLLIALETTGVDVTHGFDWPLLLSTFGAFAVWRGASHDERNHIQELINSAPVIGGASSKNRKGVALRVIAAIASSTRDCTPSSTSAACGDRPVPRSLAP
jgi:phage shock protein PspC (stress-responsive transcriptional regulator)